MTLFFESTVDDAVYRDLGQQFVPLLELDEHDCWFQQDGATCHTANETINLLRAVFVTVLSLKIFGHHVPLI